MRLYNRTDRRILKKKLEESTEERFTLSFYKYVHIADPQVWRDELFMDWSTLGVYGRVYLATEGINAQISIPKTAFDKFHAYIDSQPYLQGVRLNYAVDHGKSFYKLKVKVRSKIVADGLNDATFDVTKKGVHLSAEEFNRMAEDPNTVIVDMRNHYESEIGHFENAILPDADTFRDALPMVEETLKSYKDKNIVMYCTGGIRCEKASAYFKHKGFPHVFQLEGGIIQYTREVTEKGLSNKFKGKNFVFDERLGEKITNEVISSCHQCGKPCDTHRNCKNEACHLLFIQCEECAQKYNECCSVKCQEFVSLPEEEQKILRKGALAKRNVFRKGRAQHLKSEQKEDPALKQ